MAAYYFWLSCASIGGIAAASLCLLYYTENIEDFGESFPGKIFNVFYIIGSEHAYLYS